MNLAEFLLARIAEDEAVAAEAGADDWEVVDQRKVRWVRNDGGAHGWVAIADLSTATAHIARHDPARVLAECAAWRRIVERAEVWGDHLDGVLRDLALPHADHPDYDPSWRP